MVCFLADKLVIIGAGHEQLHAYKLASKIGLKTIGVDKNKLAPGLKLADHRVISSSRDYKKILSILKMRFKSIKGVMTLANDVPLSVAYIASKLGLPSMNLETAKITSNKILMKNAFRSFSVSTPNYKLVNSVMDIDFLLKKWNKIIIKPVDNRGSRGVSLVDDKDAIENCYLESLKNSFSNQVIVEEFIGGPQISCEGFVLNGKCYIVANSDRNYKKLQKYKPHIIEDGGALPSKISRSIRTKIELEMQRAADAVGLFNGPIKGDIVLDKKKVYVIEIASRLSGGYFCTDQIPLTTGVDLVEQTIYFSIGRSIDPISLVPKHLTNVAIRYWFPQTGCLKKVPDIDLIRRKQGVCKADIHHKVGTCFSKVNKHSDRLGFVMTKSDISYYEAEKKAKEIINLYQDEFKFI